jgi:succinate-semialdehyde dehydrogenase / glutarate-semialdehyde dehydrogenase
VHSTDEAVRLANESSYGLSAGVWGSRARAQAVARRLRAGTVNVNEIFGVSHGSVDSPMGGMKQSGVGRRHGVEGLLRFTEAQTIATQRGMQLEPPVDVGYDALARAYTTACRLFKTVGRR